jgi:tetratricopeptide (TPR) repeat protein
LTTANNSQKPKLFDPHRDVWICLFLAMSILAVYWPVNSHEFVNYDDSLYVFENPQVKKGLDFDAVIWAFQAMHAGNWHPLTWLSHMADVALYGLAPGAHHMTSVLFHMVNSLLLFIVLRRMSAAVWPSGFVAALFALHPLHVESVAWVAERKDVLSAFFWMLTMLSYARYAERPGINRYLAVVVFFILGLMAKPMLVTLPFVLLLLDYWPLRRLQFQRSAAAIAGSLPLRSSGLWLVWEKIPLFLLSIASSVITFWAQKEGGAVGSIALYPLTTRVANALVSYVKYIGKTIWPVDLAVFYPHPGSLPGWQVVGAGILLGLITFAALRSFRERPWFVVGWLWFVGTLVPVIGLVQVGLQAMADRYTYIPLIGLFMMLAWGTPELIGGWRHKKKLLAAATAALLTVFIVLSWLQTRYWQNSLTLYERALGVTSNNYVLHNNLGFALTARNRSEEAIPHYEAAVRINPAFELAYVNLGIALLSQGKTDQCIAYYQDVLRQMPGFASVHNNLGILLLRKGKIENAIFHFREALRINPDYAEAHNSLGAALVFEGKIQDAILSFKKALQLKPDYFEPKDNLAKLSALRENDDQPRTILDVN